MAGRDSLPCFGPEEYIRDDPFHTPHPCAPSRRRGRRRAAVAERLLVLRLVQGLLVVRIRATASSSAKPSGTVTVFAAASLKESFTALGKKFEQRYPGTKVTFDFGGSDTLAASITGALPPTCSPPPAARR